jgi:hypothetical protein
MLISNLPDTITLYLESAERELGISGPQAPDPVGRGERVLKKVLEMLSSIIDPREHRYCVLVHTCLCNYMEKLNERHLPARDPEVSEMGIPET